MMKKIFRILNKLSEEAICKSIQYTHLNQKAYEDKDLEEGCFLYGLFDNYTDCLVWHRILSKREKIFLIKWLTEEDRTAEINLLRRGDNGNEVLQSYI